MNDQPPTPKLTHANLRQFSGDLERYRHPLARKMIYTEGVKFVAEQGEAYWLIDEIALAISWGEVLKASEADMRILELHFWRLDVKDKSATLTARADSDAAPFYTKDISFTNFPLDHIDIWAEFDGKHWTLYLPSEH